MKHPQIIFPSVVFMVYQSWGVWLILQCINEDGENCIGAMWWLLLTGLPSTLILTALHIGYPGLWQLITYSVVGGLQWLVLSHFAMKGIRKLAQRKHRTPNQAL